ncbi:unnamed protein product, partial [Pylaiella littoralis]
ERQPNDILSALGSGKSHSSDYEIARPIGKGKFAVVYQAKRKNDGTRVALKKVSVSAIDERSRAKCIREVGLLQSLDHCNIIRYVDFFLEESELVIVLEWAAAGDLKRQVRKALRRGVHFEERIIWGYFSQICGAISYMHQQRVMHRDLKPANIFLTLKGQVKVGDLGLGRLMADGTAEAFSKVGTPLYMSPEVLGGGGYSWKSDVWSLGCVLYELAMLRSPFKCEGLNLYSLFQKISNGDYPPLLDYYSDELRALATGMISTSPTDRPSVDEACCVADHMKRATSSTGEPATAPPETAHHLKPKVSPPKRTASAAVDKDDEHQAAAHPCMHNPPQRGSVGTTATGAPAAVRAAAAAAAAAPVFSEMGAVAAATAVAVRTRGGGSRNPCPRPAAGVAGAPNNVNSECNNGNNQGRHRHSCHCHQKHHHNHNQNQNHHRQHDSLHNKNDNNDSGCFSRRGEKEEFDAFGQQHQRNTCVFQAAENNSPNHCGKHNSTSTSNRSRGRSGCDCNNCGCRSGKVALVAVAEEVEAMSTVGTKTHGVATAAATTAAAAAVTLGKKSEEEEDPIGAYAKSTANFATKASAVMMKKKDDRCPCRPEQQQQQQRPADLIAPPPFVVVDHAAATPPAAVAAGGVLLPRVRAGSMAAKARATRGAAAKTTAALGSTQQHQQHQPLATDHDDVANGDAATAAAYATVVVASRTFLPPVVFGSRRARTNNNNNTNTTTSGTATAAASSPSSSSAPPRGRRQKGARGRGEQERNRSSGGGSRSRSIGGCGGGGGGGGGGIGDRNDDVEMMMTAENDSNAVVGDGEDGDDDAHQDNEENSSRRRIKERRERRKKRSDHNNRHNRNKNNDNDNKSNSGNGDGNSGGNRVGAAAGGDGGGSGEGAGGGPKLEKTGIQTGATAAASLGRDQKGSKRQRRNRRHGSMAPADAATVAAAATTAAAAAVVAAAAAIAGAAPDAAAKGTQGPRSVMSASGSTGQGLSVSGDNLVAMETLLDRLSILGYGEDLTRRNEPSLSSRLHFIVPGGSDGSSDGSDKGSDKGSGGGDGRRRRAVFPSRREQFLSFVALTKWLLGRLGDGSGGGGGVGGGSGGSGGGALTITPSNTPTTACAKILEECQALGFRASRKSGARARATTAMIAIATGAPAGSAVSPASLAVGSGAAVLELLGWLSKAVLKNLEKKRDGENNANSGVRRTFTTKNQKDKSGDVPLPVDFEDGEEDKVEEEDEEEDEEGRDGRGQEQQHQQASNSGGRGTSTAQEKEGVFIPRRNGAPPSSGDGGGGGLTNKTKQRQQQQQQRRLLKTLPEMVMMMATAVVSSSAGCFSSSSCCSCPSAFFGWRDFGSVGAGLAVFSGGSQDGRLTGGGKVGGGGGGGQGLHQLGGMLEPTVDPKAWRAEQKRVAPRLAKAAAAATAAAAAAKAEAEAAAVAISRELVGDTPFPVAAAVAAAIATKTTGDGDCGGGRRVGSSGSRGRRERSGSSRAAAAAAARGEGDHRSSEDCCESMLVSLGGMVSRQLAAVAAGERRIYDSQQRQRQRQQHGGAGGGGGDGGDLAHFQEEARLLKAEESAVREELAERQARVATLTDKLRDADDAVDEMKIKVAETAHSCSDPTNLYKAKSAIRQLKADIKAMDVLIGAKSATVLGKQLGLQRAGREAEEKNPVGSRWGGSNVRKQQDRGGGGGGGFGYGGDGATLPLSTPSRSISPASTASASSTTAATTAISSASSRGCGGGGGGGGLTGGVDTASSTVRGGSGGSEQGGLKPRRSSVLIKEAVGSLS